MAYEIATANAHKITLVAGADLSSAQYKFVKISSGNAVVCAAATDRPIGVLQNAPASGQEAEIVVVGGTKVIAGGSITAGAAIGTNGSALAAAKTVGTDTTHYIAGTALSGGSANEVISAIIDCAAAGRAA